MQLSIEAIIILVIAIVLLGLGIAFIKNFFGQAATPLEGQLGSLKSCNANAQTPFLPTTYKLQQGTKEAGVEVCVFNNEAAKLVDAKIKIDECLTPAGTTVSAANSKIKIQTLKFDLDRSKSGLIPITIDATTTTTADIGTYICGIKVEKDSALASDPSLGPVQVTIEVQ
jgi:hypothetical protein